MIIQSTLDQDQYKLCMQKAILAYQQHVPAKYKFVNRRPEGKFNTAFIQAFEDELHGMQYLSATESQLQFVAARCPYLGDDYLDYLRNYRFDPNQVKARLVNNELDLVIEGTWETAIWWEVPLMALISELFFLHCDTDWELRGAEQCGRLIDKATALSDMTFSDFGTRRRRTFSVQNLVVETLASLQRDGTIKGFMGTSNVHLAHKHNVRPMGTMAHEWIMGISALEGMRHANRHALRIWSDTFQGRCGIALTDTFGSDAFFEDFDGYLARLFDGVRHDSACPFDFAKKTIDHYLKLGIDPLTKTIVFSDGLNVDVCVRIAAELTGKIRFAFGIGTNFTNDFGASRPLNMVIKLIELGGVPLVKLSDVLSKAIGDTDALRVARWVFVGTPLDTEKALMETGL